MKTVNGADIELSRPRSWDISMGYAREVIDKAITWLPDLIDRPERIRDSEKKNSP